MIQSESTETRKRKYTPADIQALEQRARDFAAVTDRRQRERVRKQARYAYDLGVLFRQAGVLGGDYVRWLSKHSGVDYATCWRRYKLGVRLAQGVPHTTQALLVAEQRRIEKTPRPDLDLDWGDED